MATINVRLKDASGNVLHPETDWSLVQNKPSIEIDKEKYQENWNTNDSVHITASGGIYLDGTATEVTAGTMRLWGQSGIQVNTSNKWENLEDYAKSAEWDKIVNKPSFPSLEDSVVEGSSDLPILKSSRQAIQFNITVNTSSPNDNAGSSSIGFVYRSSNQIFTFSPAFKWYQWGYGNYGPYRKYIYWDGSEWTEFTPSESTSGDGIFRYYPIIIF